MTASNYSSSPRNYFDGDDVQTFLKRIAKIGQNVSKSITENKTCVTIETDEKWVWNQLYWKPDKICVMIVRLKNVEIYSYSSLSNNHTGCNKHAGWKNLQNLGDFKNEIVYKINLRLF